MAAVLGEERGEYLLLESTECTVNFCVSLTGLKRAQGEVKHYFWVGL